MEQFSDIELALILIWFIGLWAGALSLAWILWVALVPERFKN